MRHPRLVPVGIGAALLIVLTTRVATRTERSHSATAIQQPPPLEVILQRSASYLDAYAVKLATVVAQEDYSFKGTRTNEKLTSDILLIGIDGSWAEFRDVFQVNSRAVRDHQARLESLLGDPSTVLAKAQQIMDESARYNAGVVHRNINVPTMALTYLLRGNQPRSSFRLLGTGDKGAAIVGFQETARPPLIHSSAGVVETSGRFWLDPTNGAVTKSELVVKNPEGGAVKHDTAVSGSVTVTYEPDDSLGFLVPRVMDEEYQQPTSIVGRASYSHYKAFGVIVSISRGRGGR